MIKSSNSVRIPLPPVEMLTDSLPNLDAEVESMELEIDQAAESAVESIEIDFEEPETAVEEYDVEFEATDEEAVAELMKNDPFAQQSDAAIQEGAEFFSGKLIHISEVARRNDIVSVPWAPLPLASNQ